MPSFDAIVIGGGCNGMAAAGRLAKAGKRVLLLEARATFGGAAETREFAPGYHVSSLAHLVHVLDPRVEKALRLDRHGLTYAASDLATTALAPDGAHVRLGGGYGETVAGAITPEQAAAWQTLRKRLFAHAENLRAFNALTPPRLAKSADNDLLALAKIGWNLRRRGKTSLRDFLRLLLINVYDVLDEELEHDLLKGLVAHDTVLGGFMGPRSPNSLLLLLRRLAGEVAGRAGALALPQGGMGAVAHSMAAAIAAIGVECRSDARVAAITIADDRVTGVRLASGEDIAAPLVLSALNPRTTLLGLAGAHHFDTGFVRKLRDIRMRGTTAKLHLALKGAPDFHGADLATRLVIAPSADAVEAQFNPVKYNRCSTAPVMEIMLPSALDPGAAPPGHHVLSAIVQFAPSEPAGGWDTARAPFLAAIMAQLETYAPGIGDLVVASELITPDMIERDYGMIGGNWHHGELAAERMLFLRPFPALAQYATPIGGLYLAGAGSHPGGGISGAAGWNAATAILKGAHR
jgi:phytoene dehydrogenase-like protein